MSTPSQAAALHTLTAIRSELSELMVEREREIDAVLISLVGRFHCVLLGAPGVGKSTLINEACKRLDLTVFQQLIFRELGVGQIFGPLSVKRLVDDDEEARTLRYASTAQVWFLDEIWKGSPALLNALLTALEERAIDNNGVRHTLPLVSCFGASNEPPQDESLRALRDRLAFCLTVPRLSSGGRLELSRRMVGWQKNGRPAIKSRLTSAEMSDLWELCDSVEVPDKILELIHMRLIPQLAIEGIETSDRRSTGPTIRALQASAILNGREIVTLDDIAVLQFVLWEYPEHEEAARKVVMSMNDVGQRLAAIALNGIGIYISEMTSWASANEAAQEAIIIGLISKLKVVQREAEELIATVTAKGGSVNEANSIMLSVPIHDHGMQPLAPLAAINAILKDARDRY